MKGYDTLGIIDIIMEILFTICGRAGSKGLKNKNLKNLLGKPLVLYSLSAIDLYLKRNPELKADIVINTDSTDLKDIVVNSKIRDVHTIDRTEELSGDVIGKIDVIRDSLVRMSDRLNKDYDYVVDLDITSPLRTVKNLEDLINKMLEVKTDLVISVTSSRRNPYFNMVEKKSDGNYSKVIDNNFTARQQASDVYDINGSLYIYSNEFLRANKYIFDSKLDIIEMEDTGVLDIDKKEDYLLMEIIGKYLFENIEGFKEIKNNIK